MRQFPCKGGRVVEVIDEDHWVVPYTTFHTQTKLNVDFTQLPGEMRTWWRSLLLI